jgi:carboxyl-terminal processing protease
MLRRLLACVLGVAILSSMGGNLQLKKSDVRPTVENMLEYHVEYKELSPLIARRSVKIYLEQFDSNKTYLLSSEVQPHLNLSEAELDQIIANYKKGNFSHYEAMGDVIQKAIGRARGYRLALEKELIENEPSLSVQVDEPYGNYAKDPQELKERLRRQLVSILAIEKKSANTASWGAPQRKKVFDLWERRFARMENPYLPSATLTEHYFCLHLLRSMAKSLDAHTSYFSPEEASEMRTSLEKQFEGIGVVLREGVDGVAIHSTLKGSPAERCGKIVSGDLIVEIDGTSIEGAPYEEVLRRMQGTGDGKVQLGLRRPREGGLYSVTLKREKIVMQEERVSLSYEPFADGYIGKIVLPSFYEAGGGLSCEEDLKTALRSLKMQGSVYGLVIDMRDNSGGFLTQAVKVAGLFISSGVVVISKYSGGVTQYLRDIDGKSYYDGPLVILTSRASASAAEIVAQALQDYGRALVVGDDRTYGKGTIQYQNVTDPTASSFFKVTIGRYYTVSGRTTQIDGVKADLIVPTIYSSFPIGERYLEYPLRSDRIPSAYIDQLSDVDARQKPWYQKNYLPHLQKRLSSWSQMTPALQKSSEYRLKNNKNYALFLEAVQKRSGRIGVSPSPQNNWGVEDLQMQEAVNILKDAVLLKTKTQDKIAAWLKSDLPVR